MANLNHPDWKIIREDAARPNSTWKIQGREPPRHPVVNRKAAKLFVSVVVYLVVAPPLFGLVNGHLLPALCAGVFCLSAILVGWPRDHHVPRTQLGRDVQTGTRMLGTYWMYTYVRKHLHGHHKSKTT